MKKIIFVMACVLSLLGVGVNTHAATTTISGNISSIQMIGKTVTKSHSKAEIEYTAINKNSVREPLNIQNCEQGNYPNYLHGTIQLIEGNSTKVKLNKAYPKGTKMYITVRPVGLSTGFPTAVKVTH